MLRVKTMNKLSSLAFVLAAVLAASLSFGPASASVSGPCANCHTMHNSQGGTDMVVGGGDAKAVLLTNDCVGCHTGTNTGGTTPFVLSDTGAPTFGSNTLSGGNFWWVENEDDAKGHNVFQANPDGDLSIAPGGVIGCGGVGSNACHRNLNQPYSGAGILTGRYGCTGCHMIGAEGPKGFHHADDGPSGENTLVNSQSQGWYRFLTGHEGHHGPGYDGVAGIEHDKWNYGATAGSHNEYLGVPGGGDISNNAMTSYCSGCHATFHNQESGGNWIRHPSDAVIQATGEYAGAFGGTYDPGVPVARPSLTVVSGDVTPGTDMVMCLSCHVAHGSPYDDLLRWDYTQMVAGSSNTGGCFQCHTGKTTAP